MTEEPRRKGFSRKEYSLEEQEKFKRLYREKIEYHKKEKEKEKEKEK